ncbi:hypothetical protein CLAIMM_12359, partial [Cladophialophora immunda]
GPSGENSGFERNEDRELLPNRSPCLFSLVETSRKVQSLPPPEKPTPDSSLGRRPSTLNSGRVGGGGRAISRAKSSSTTSGWHSLSTSYLFIVIKSSSGENRPLEQRTCKSLLGPGFVFDR